VQIAAAAARRPGRAIAQKLHMDPIGSPAPRPRLRCVAGKPSGRRSKERRCVTAENASGPEPVETASTEPDTGADVQQDGDFQGDY